MEEKIAIPSIFFKFQKSFTCFCMRLLLFMVCGEKNYHTLVNFVN